MTIVICDVYDCAYINDVICSCDELEVFDKRCTYYESTSEDEEYPDESVYEDDEE